MPTGSPTKSTSSLNVETPAVFKLFINIFGVPDKFAAVPDVFWLPAILTPGKFMFAVPSNDTPPIVLAVCNWVAEAATPTIFPVIFPVRLPVTLPTNVVADIIFFQFRKS